MKRTRDAIASAEADQQDEQRIKPGFLTTPVAAGTAATAPAAVDDDPYGFGNIGAPGFMNKPSGMKAGGFVPGYLRIPGASGAMAPGATAMKSARTAVTGPGAQPRPAPTTAKPSSTSHPQASAPQAQGTSAAGAAASLAATQAAPQAAGAATAAANAGSKQVQGQEAAEQLLLPDDTAGPADAAPKPSASATGPISAQIQALPGFNAEIEDFVAKATPTQEEQLTKVQHQLLLCHDVLISHCAISSVGSNLDCSPNAAPSSGNALHHLHVVHTLFLPFPLSMVTV